jgi:hypothetical protein
VQSLIVPGLFCLSPQVTRADGGDVSVAFAGDKVLAIKLEPFQVRGGGERCPNNYP